MYVKRPSMKQPYNITQIPPKRERWSCRWTEVVRIYNRSKFHNGHVYLARLNRFPVQMFDNYFYIILEFHIILHLVLIVFEITRSVFHFPSNF